MIETKERVSLFTSIFCDVCGKRCIVTIENPAKARTEAAEWWGMHYDGDKDYCPTCWAKRKETC